MKNKAIVSAEVIEDVALMTEDDIASKFLGSTVAHHIATAALDQRSSSEKFVILLL